MSLQMINSSIDRICGATKAELQTYLSITFRYVYGEHAVIVSDIAVIVSDILIGSS